MSNDEHLSNTYSHADELLNDLYNRLYLAQYIIQSPYATNETPFERARTIHRILSQAQKSLAHILAQEEK